MEAARIRPLSLARGFHRRQLTRVIEQCERAAQAEASMRRTSAVVYPRRPMMDSSMYPQPTAELARKRRELAPKPLEAFKAFSAAVFAEGALPTVTKQLIAVAVAHTTQCPYCIKGHTQGALKAGASEEQIMEAIWVAAEMRAGGAYAHSALALDTMPHAHDHSGS
jgi:AhpD family alkylhydroperoxidase